MGTRYDMSGYVDKAESALVHLITRLEKRKYPSKSTEDKITQVTDVLEAPAAVAPEKEEQEAAGWFGWAKEE